MSRTHLLRRPALLAGVTLLSSALVLPATAIGAEPTAPTAGTAATGPVSSLVRVSTPTPADKDRLLALGLDVTEHATDEYVEVVLHGAGDLQLLSGSGLEHVVEVADLAAQSRENRELDAAYAASVAASPLPSGRTSYRTLAEYDEDMATLATENPALVKPLTLPEPTIEGRPVNGIEITRDVAAKDGKPVFLLMGLHHAREWPSGEHAIEFAFDLVNRHKAGDARTVDLLSRARVIVVPVVNPDGFNASITSGAVDGRAIDDGGQIAILGTPGNAYRRKNCRPLPQTPTGQACVAQPGQGGFGTGVDLNRNYGGLWGGAGAAATPEDPTYRGAAPFSEPETRNVRALVSSRQVTTLITNHTFSNLVLRPPGVRAQGPPPDETVYEALGARMTAQNGYVNQPSYALYDTTGTTEDWTYYATGGLGFTFEIGEEFHPPYERVVEHYVGGTTGEDRGAGPFVDKGNREAYYQALMSTADTALHSVLTGSAPAGAELVLEKTFTTETSEVVSPVPGAPAGPRQDFEDTLRSSMTVGPDGTFTWHTNPSTRPAVMSKRLEELGEPLQSETFEGGPTPPGVGSTDHLITVTDPAAKVMQVDLTWPTPDDMDLEVYRKEGDTLTQVASSGNFVTEKEQAFVEDVTPGEYVLRQINFASASPTYTLTAKVYDEPEITVTPGKVEAYTMVCRIDELEKRRQPVVVARGQQVTVSDPCGVSGAVDPTPIARDILRACPDARVPEDSRGDIAGNTHERAIDCMVWYGIAEGYDDERYGPEAPVSRGQMASFVARLVEKSGGSFPAASPDAFADDDSSTHEANINKLAAVKIVQGRGGRYDADAVITRDQMAAFLVRAYEYRSGRTIAPRGDYFDDDGGTTHEAAINKSAEAGFTGGRDGAYQPAAPVLRDQMASFLSRVLDLHVTQGTTQAKQ